MFQAACSIFLARLCPIDGQTYRRDTLSMFKGFVRGLPVDDSAPGAKPGYQVGPLLPSSDLCSFGVLCPFCINAVWCERLQCVYSLDSDEARPPQGSVLGMQPVQGPHHDQGQAWSPSVAEHLHRQSNVHVYNGHHVRHVSSSVLSSPGHQVVHINSSALSSRCLRT